MILDIVALVLVLLGAILCLTASIGLLRFPDVVTRLHAATKPQVLGMLIIAIAVAVGLRSWAALAFIVPIIVIQMASAPLAAHMVGRQAYRNRSVDDDSMIIDELADDIDVMRDSG
ncbi:putative cation antiporter subunit [Microbacterium faecale]|uniref:Cation antiporter subunit n=1 Tax=Microbacterium faecale TaxID=1804630 RepID=A0A916Y1R2_9MICO|nr:monovalent cation/H(+) antiporter subunit G [Microbacterium faecale]GGD27210.1 putative cation antiporter subunit [Microbacterium faecale]HJB63282.1 monovalent cation/H(+) antiporter subunit G [Candidatus Microbacterium pullistercoris]